MDIFLLCTALKYTCFFFFNDTATTEIYTLSLHDALPICTETCGRGYRKRAAPDVGSAAPGYGGSASRSCEPASARGDRKSTRLNSSHLVISYAVFCFKKKKHNDVRTVRAAIQHQQLYNHT